MFWIVSDNNALKDKILKKNKTQKQYDSVALRLT